MLTKRIIPCLDVNRGRVVKGVRFRDLREVGDPVGLAERYVREGADELMFLDVGASVEERGILLDAVRAVARTVFIPFSVGGGVRSLDDMRLLLDAGADKVSVNTAAVERPAFVDEAARAFGSQFVVVSIDALCGETGGKVTTHGGRRATDREVVSWAREVAGRGAGEILLNVINADGTQAGYDLGLTREVAEAVPIPVIASGGAGSPADLVAVFREGKADAALAASIFHSGKWTVAGIKRELQKEGIPVRP
jgi:cyclase